MWNGCAIASCSFCAMRPEHVGIVEVLDDHHELVAAEAGEQVGLAQRGGERPRHVLQQLVADAVAQRVVDVLEAVEVDEQHADAPPRPARLRDRLRQSLVQQQAVRQAGQRVARRHVLQPFLGLDPRADVLHEREDRHDAAGLVEQARVVPLAPDRLAVDPVVAREAGCTGLLAPDQLGQHRRGRLAVGLVDQRVARQRHPEHLVGAPAEDVLGLRRPPDEPEIAIPLQHRQRRVVDVRGEHPVGAAQRLLVALLLVDVGVHRVDADDVGLGVAVGRVVDLLPAHLAVLLRQQQLGGDGLAGEHPREQRLELREAGLPGQFRDRTPGHLLPVLAHPLLFVAVDEPVAVLAVDVRHARRHVVHDQPQLGLGGAQRFLRLLEPVDVVHQHERAVHLARRPGVRHHADRHPAAHAARARDQPVEGGRFALQRPGQHRLRALVDAVADDVAQAQFGHLLGGQAEVLQEGAIDVVAVLVAVDVRDRRRHAVHDDAQLRLAGRQRVLHLLQVGDVVADDVDALDRAVELEVRDDLRAQPARTSLRVDGRALVGHRLARQRASARTSRRSAARPRRRGSTGCRSRVRATVR